MKKYLLVTVLIVPLFSFCGFSQCVKYEPPDGKIMLFIGQDCNATGGTSYGTGYIDDTQIATLPKPAGVTTYASVSLADGAGITSLIDYGAGPLHASQYIGNSNFTNSVISIGLYMTDGAGNTLNVPGGGYNSKLDALSNWIKSIAPRPVFLRIGYEFETQYGNSSTNYKNAYRYIVDRFNAQSVTNVAYVWQAACGCSGTSYLYNWYPGDAYVDWMAYSHFEYSGNQFEGNDIFALARQYRKPVMIAEATPRGYNLANSSSATSAWNNYFTRLFNKINANMDVVKALCYINQDWDAQSLWAGQGWGNSRIQANGNGTIENNWITELSKPHWLHASSGLFSLLQNNTQSPYSGAAVSLPGKIEAENFDLGCIGEAYQDGTGGNAGNSIYRYGSSVDIGTTVDGGGGLSVAYTTSNEWLEYTVNVSTSASYKITFRTATLNPGNTFHLEVDGTNVSGTINVPVTAGWETYTDIILNNIPMTSGTHVLRIAFDNTPGFNLNHFTFDLPAPVELGDWKAIRSDDRTVTLSWVTFQESNNKGFEIERSTDGKTFEKITFVSGHGDSNAIQYYSYVDENATALHLYYRLIQLDNNETQTISNTILVNKTSLPVAFPNPFRQSLLINNLPENSTLTISDLNGRIICEGLSESDGLINFDVNASPGLYIVLVRTEFNTFRIPIVKSE